MKPHLDHRNLIDMPLASHKHRTHGRSLTTSNLQWKPHKVIPAWFYISELQPFVNNEACFKQQGVHRVGPEAKFTNRRPVDAHGLHACLYEYARAGFTEVREMFVEFFQRPGIFCLE